MCWVRWFRAVLRALLGAAGTTEVINEHFGLWPVADRRTRLRLRLAVIQWDLLDEDALYHTLEGLLQGLRLHGAEAAPAFVWGGLYWDTS